MGNECIWKAVGASVQGDSHKRKEKPCQDYMGIKELKDAVIVAVADGHGSSRSPFSDEGAQIAVNIALTILENMYMQCTNISAIKQISEEQLKRIIVRRWREEVEKAHLKKEEQEDNGDFYVKYGATLLAVIASSEYIFFMQLGDGDIVGILSNGEVAYGVNKDEGLIGVETTSLCSRNAWKDIKTEIYKLNSTNTKIEMIMLSTDGYYNSFADDEGFKKSALDYYELIKQHGIEKVGTNLEKWLDEISENGSGDDITLAIICLNSVNTADI